MTACTTWSLDGVPKPFSPSPPSSCWTSNLCVNAHDISRELFTSWCTLALEDYVWGKLSSISDAPQHYCRSLLFVARRPKLDFLHTLFVHGVCHWHVEAHRGLVGICNLPQLATLFPLFVHHISLKLHKLLLKVSGQLLTHGGQSSQAEPEQFHGARCPAPACLKIGSRETLHEGNFPGLRLNNLCRHSHFPLFPDEIGENFFHLTVSARLWSSKRHAGCCAAVRPVVSAIVTHSFCARRTRAALAGVMLCPRGERPFT